MSLTYQAKRVRNSWNVQRSDGKLLVINASASVGVAQLEHLDVT